MNDSEYNELREASWQRRLTAAEEARVQGYLAAHLEAQADWEDDLALTRQLQGLPDAPLSSRFTSLVFQAVDRQALPEPRPIAPESWRGGWLNRFAPRIALAVVALALGL